MFGSMKTEQQRNKYESYEEKIVSMRKIGPGGHGFTSGVSPNKTGMHEG